MAVSTQSFFPQSTSTYSIGLSSTNYTGPGAYELASFQTGGDVVNFMISSTDSVDRVGQIIVETLNGSTYLLGTVAIPANAGNSTSVPHVNVLTNTVLGTICIDSNGSPFLRMPMLTVSGTTPLFIGIQLTAAPTALATITVTITINNF